MAPRNEHAHGHHGAHNDEIAHAPDSDHGPRDDHDARDPGDDPGANDRRDDPGANDPHEDDARRVIHDDARRQIIRRATLFSAGFLAAGLVIALAGAALVAWLFSRGRLPFFETWLVVTAIIVLPGLVAAGWKLIRDR